MMRCHDKNVNLLVSILEPIHINHKQHNAIHKNYINIQSDNCQASRHLHGSFPCISVLLVKHAKALVIPDFQAVTYGID